MSRMPLATVPVLTALSLASVILVSAVGCSSLRSTFSRGQSEDELASIKDVTGPAERAIKQVGHSAAGSSATKARDLAALQDDPALLQAQSLYDAGRYQEAERAFKKIKNKFSTELATGVLGEGGVLDIGKEDRAVLEQYGSPVEERAMFMVAESQFMQGLYPDAQNSYDALINRYPSTRHLDTATRRTFLIARHWLGFPPSEIPAGGDIEQASFETAVAAADPKRAPAKPSFFNWSDPTRPRLDATGRALNALKSIWLNDPTGPLADDALMLTANHYFRNGNRIEAGRYYELLRDQYPDSAHVKSAHLLESHVRLASYDGPAYDAANLDQSLRLKEAALQSFDLSPEERKRLQDELTNIDEAKVAREWATVELYRQKGRPEAVQLYCNYIINNFPESQYAARARRMLQTLAAERRGGGGSSWFSNPLASRTKPAPRSKPSPDKAGLNPATPPALKPPPAAEPATKKPVTQQTEQRDGWFRFGSSDGNNANTPPSFGSSTK